MNFSSATGRSDTSDVLKKSNTILISTSDRSQRGKKLNYLPVYRRIFRHRIWHGVGHIGCQTLRCFVAAFPVYTPQLVKSEQLLNYFLVLLDANIPCINSRVRLSIFLCVQILHCYPQ